MRLLFRLLARLSLRANHALGGLIGRIAFAVSPRLRQRTLGNLRASGLAGDEEGVWRMARENAAQVGMAATELAWAHLRHPQEVETAIVDQLGWEDVLRLRAAGRAIIFVSPHLGGYDVAGRVLLTRLPILAMYRPHKIGWLDEIVREGRNRGAAFDGTNVAPATRAGVRAVLKHLKAGGCSFVLPDQVPGEGDGEWAEFFGRPAYTMTLIGRLQEATGATLVFCYAERLAGGAGFRMHFVMHEESLGADRATAVRRVNEIVEQLVRSCPAQYLWGYNRYKRPAGAPPPPA